MPRVLHATAFVVSCSRQEKTSTKSPLSATKRTSVYISQGFSLQLARAFHADIETLAPKHRHNRSLLWALIWHGREKEKFVIEWLSLERSQLDCLSGLPRTPTQLQAENGKRQLPQLRSQQGSLAGGGMCHKSDRVPRQGRVYESPVYSGRSPVSLHRATQGVPAVEAPEQPPSSAPSAEVESASGGLLDREIWLHRPYKKRACSWYRHWGRLQSDMMPTAHREYENAEAARGRPTWSPNSTWHPLFKGAMRWLGHADTAIWDFMGNLIDSLQQITRTYVITHKHQKKIQKPPWHS